MTSNNAFDVSGNGNHGTLTNGPKKTIGKLGQALNFDGVDDYVFVNDPGDSSVLDFDTSSTITMSAWIRKSSITSYPLIVTKGRSNGSYTNYAIRSGDGTGSERKFSFFYRNSANTAWHVYDTVSNVFEVGNWYHVAVSYTFGTGSSIKMYINGVEMPGGWVAGTGNDAPLVGNYQLWIGDDNANSEFHGLIDEVRVYNRALSADEIKRLYKIGATMKINMPSNTGTLKDGLVGMWTFDGNDMSGNTAIDRSGNGNNGTLTNGPKKAIGKIGQALNFDGVNDEVNIPDNDTIDFNTNANFTISFWVKIPSSNQPDTSNSDNEIIEKWDQVDSRYPYVIRFNNHTAGANSNTLSVARYDGTNNPGITTTKKYNDANWHFFVFQKAGSTLYLYADRDSPQTATDTTTGVTTNTSKLYFARRGHVTNDNFFRGSLDEVRIYNRALSAEEIKRLYNMGR
ncbi:MAG: hemagglutination activity domain protein [Parcubacteria group bacterium GW2011_GWA2_47_12]|nr:MAG: hemagglutination activity domain protein [Parcubacteria group bacterium GW2011_GWA2_47_12]